MSNNAQWWVECEVTTPSGNTMTTTVSLSSPDLADTKEAHKRARKTAEERELRKQQKAWGASGHLVKVRAVSSRCVG